MHYIPLQELKDGPVGKPIIPPDPPLVSIKHGEFNRFNQNKHMYMLDLKEGLENFPVASRERLVRAVEVIAGKICELDDDLLEIYPMPE